MRRRGMTGQALTGTAVIDSDGDGLADGWELAHFGNLAQNGDEDIDNDGRRTVPNTPPVRPVRRQPEPWCAEHDPIARRRPGAMTSLRYRRASASATAALRRRALSEDALTWPPACCPMAARRISANGEECEFFVPAALASGSRCFACMSHRNIRGAID